MSEINKIGVFSNIPLNENNVKENIKIEWGMLKEYDSTFGLYVTEDNCCYKNFTEKDRYKRLLAESEEKNDEEIFR